MNVWIWRDCEPLPFDRNNPRLMRAGMLAKVLSRGGHHVRWFNSTFDHYQKQFRDMAVGSHPMDGGGIVELVKGHGYSTNGAPRRLIHNALVARRFVDRAEQIVEQSGSRPDIIVADLPMPDSALAGARLARRWNIPSVISIRDLWPDFFVHFLSPGKAALASPVIAHINRTVRAACREADHLIGISPGYLNWGLRKAGRQREERDGVVPLGYAPPTIPSDKVPSVRKQLAAKGIDFSKNLATFIGSWGRTYDLSMLAKVVERLSHRSDIQFVVAGKGEQCGGLQKAAENFPNLLMPGWLDRDEIAVLLDLSEVALGPYSAHAPQGLPNKLFEYLASGTFQVTTLRGEARDVLSAAHAGLVTPPGNPEAFASAIEQAIATPSSKAERQRLINYFNEHFDADVVYAKYTRLLETFVSSKAR